ncbi:ABC transporter ATP-binding protein [Nonomuraea longicatena]|uniref:ABC transporter ATP-binding protein n=1 Tax=Nonomuraea longicatena TaxID=83682 RepID=A0ABN1QIJ6_9ACTN
MSTNPVEVNGLTSVYGDFTAVAGIDLQVRQGEIFALLGTNGAGKTTTMETLEGHRRPQGGEVRVLGLDPFRNRRRLTGRVSAVLQESGFAGDLTASETLRLWQRLHPGRSGPPDPLALVDLGHRADVRVKQLSGGERRRLDLALAVSTDPELLFLDEPTTGLDPASRERTWRILRDLRAEGRTILLTTHYLEEAEALSDRVSIMDRGTIAISGTLAEVVASHAARIRCALPPGAGPLPPFEGESVLDGGLLTVWTRRLQQDLHRLLAWAEREGHELGRLSAADASLAEVFASVRAESAAAELEGVR